MKIHGTHFRTLWLDEGRSSVSVIDQTELPHRFEMVRLGSLDEVARAIVTMVVRGAPLIGVTAAFGVALALREDPSDASLARALATLEATRPTAVNLRWTMKRMAAELGHKSRSERFEAALALAQRLAEEDVAINRAIGEHGFEVFRAIARDKGKDTLQVATHCNAGWLGTVDHGTALAPIYRAHDAGLGIHVFVDETRPRFQGAALTSFELGQHGVPHTIVPDGASAHILRTARVDVVIVGCDRVARNGDTANKIGTYPLALAAMDNGVPFYVALPSRTLDFSLEHGDAIPIEERAAGEVLEVTGVDASGVKRTVRVAAPGANARNPAFDVTPARLVRGFISERGVLDARDLHRLVEPA
jgi:methylthioribose-1-phosphate isomerase